MPFIIKNSSEIEGIKKSCVVTANCLKHLADNMKVGMSTAELEDLTTKYANKFGAVSAVLGYQGFPGSFCVARNEVACHGIPNANEILQAGDIINLDVSLILDGFYSDASIMCHLGANAEALSLISAAKECLEIGIKYATPQYNLFDIAYNIESKAKSRGYNIIDVFCGHGVGIKLHESPLILHSVSKLNFFEKKTLRDTKLKPGMTITIEPILTKGSGKVEILSDGWTAVTKERVLAAQWEHTILITDHAPIVLTC